jgi:FixJ family two-component response regulator
MIFVKRALNRVIDDDESFRIAHVESLCSLGYDAQGFASAEEFIASDGEELRDCVITDIHIPDMSGFDLCQENRYVTAADLVCAIRYRWLRPPLLARAFLPPCRTMNSVC